MTAVSVIVAEYLPQPARRVLADAGCSYIDRAGQRYLHRQPPSISAALDALSAVRLATAALAELALGSGAAALFALDERAGDDRGLKLARHPVELLEWIATRPEARPMHPGVKAYLYASDPDDILATLPFHRRAAIDDAPVEATTFGGASLVVVRELLLAPDGSAQLG